MALIKATQSLQSTQLDYILLDGSGSMSGKWWDTLAAIEAFMATLRAQNIHSHGILHIFDSTDRDLIVRDGVISDWKNLVTEDPPGLHGGSTPLYDAVNLMTRRIADLDPPKASIIIATDGDENCSISTTPAQGRNLLDWLRHQGHQITFLGVDFSNSKQANLLGASEKNTLAIQQRKLAEAGKLLGEKRIKNIRTGEDISFTADEKTDFGGYLEHQK